MEGLVYSGINNIYRIKNESGEYLCRIKGKTLGDNRRDYNPLAVGDRVLFSLEDDESDKGLIEERLERQNAFIRLNQKKHSPQYIAVNIDMLLCFTSPEEPPFRPRFLDRVIVAAESGGVTPVIVMNKCDQNLSESVMERLEIYRQLSYPVFLCSAHTGEGLKELDAFIQGKRVAVFGQSGVGKSTLLNAIEPGIDLKTSDISQKYNRGRHTTNYSLMIDRDESRGSIIDTPGIRQIFLWDIDPWDLAQWFREFQPYLEQCSFRRCMHRDEPVCGVRQALERQEIHSDRYESYLRILEDLENAQ